MQIFFSHLMSFPVFFWLIWSPLVLFTPFYLLSVSLYVWKKWKNKLKNWKKSYLLLTPYSFLLIVLCNYSSYNMCTHTQTLTHFYFCPPFYSCTFCTPHLMLCCLFMLSFIWSTHLAVSLCVNTECCLCVKFRGGVTELIRIKNNEEYDRTVKCCCDYDVCFDSWLCLLEKKYSLILSVLGRRKLSSQTSGIVACDLYLLGQNTFSIED